MIFSTNNTIFWAGISKNSFGGPVFIKQYDSGSAYVTLFNSNNYQIKTDLVEIRNNIFNSNVSTTKKDNSFVVYSTYGENKVFLFDNAKINYSVYGGEMVRKRSDDAININSIDIGNVYYMSLEARSYNSITNSDSYLYSNRSTQTLNPFGLRDSILSEFGKILIGTSNGNLIFQKNDRISSTSNITSSLHTADLGDITKQSVFAHISDTELVLLESSTFSPRLTTSWIYNGLIDHINPLVSIYQSNTNIKPVDILIPTLSIYQSISRPRIVDAFDGTISVGEGSYTRNKGTDKSDYSDSGLIISDSSTYLKSYLLSVRSSISTSLHTKSFIGNGTLSSSLYSSNTQNRLNEFSRFRNEFYSSSLYKKEQEYVSGLVNFMDSTSIDSLEESNIQNQRFSGADNVGYINKTDGTIFINTGSLYQRPNGVMSSVFSILVGNTTISDTEKGFYHINATKSDQSIISGHYTKLTTSLLNSSGSLVSHHIGAMTSSIVMGMSIDAQTKNEKTNVSINVNGTTNTKIEYVLASNNINNLTHINYLESSLSGSIGLYASDFTLAVSSKIDSDYITIDNNSIFIDTVN